MVEKNYQADAFDWTMDHLDRIIFPWKLSEHLVVFLEDDFDITHCPDQALLHWIQIVKNSGGKYSANTTLKLANKEYEIWNAGVARDAQRLNERKLLEFISREVAMILRPRVSEV